MTNQKVQEKAEIIKELKEKVLGFYQKYDNHNNEIYFFKHIIKEFESLPLDLNCFYGFCEYDLVRTRRKDKKFKITVSPVSTVYFDILNQIDKFRKKKKEVFSKNIINEQSTYCIGSD